MCKTRLYKYPFELIRAHGLDKGKNNQAKNGDFLNPECVKPAN